MAAACSVFTHPHVASGLGDDTPLPKGGFCIGEQLDGELYGASSSRDSQRPGKGPGSRVLWPVTIHSM